MSAATLCDRCESQIEHDPVVLTYKRKRLTFCDWTCAARWAIDQRHVSVRDQILAGWRAGREQWEHTRAVEPIDWSWRLAENRCKHHHDNWLEETDTHVRCACGELLRIAPDPVPSRRSVRDVLRGRRRR